MHDLDTIDAPTTCQGPVSKSESRLGNSGVGRCVQRRNLAMHATYSCLNATEMLAARMYKLGPLAVAGTRASPTERWRSGLICAASRYTRRRSRPGARSAIPPSLTGSPAAARALFALARALDAARVVGVIAVDLAAALGLVTLGDALGAVVVGVEEAAGTEQRTRSEQRVQSLLQHKRPP